MGLEIRIDSLFSQNGENLVKFRFLLVFIQEKEELINRLIILFTNVGKFLY